MAKRKVELTNNQVKRNDLILARIEAEKNRLFEETRALQQQFRRNIKRKRAEGKISIQEPIYIDD
jgi:hypothetical protein